MIPTPGVRLVQALSVCGLGLIILPSLVFFRGLVSLEELKSMMLVGTLIWFGASFLSQLHRKT